MFGYYEFRTVWHLDAPLEGVWDAIHDARGWLGWWEGLEAVEEIKPGNEVGVGTLQRYTWKGRLPYRLTFDVRVTRVERPNLIEGAASGEVEGLGCWRLSALGATTTVVYVWQVRTTKRWMNLIAPLAHPVFRWNHNQVMRRGGTGLARFLDARLLDATFCG